MLMLSNPKESMYKFHILFEPGQGLAHLEIIS